MNLPLDPQSSGFSTRRQWVRRFLAPALLLAAGGRGAGAGFDWKVIESDGRDYVRLSDIKKFYNFGVLQREGRNQFLRSKTMVMKFASGSEIVYINNVKFCLSFPTIERDGQTLVSRMDLAKLLEPIIRPNYIGATRLFDTVIIDPGHGGQDSGAVGIYGAEKAYALDTSFRLEKRLKSLNYKVILTRRTDVFIERAERVSLANKTANCVFVSVHYNSFSRSAIGLETFALAPQGTSTTDKDLKSTDLLTRRGNGRDAENIALATAVHANILYAIRGVDRGVKRARYDVLAGCEKPGILVEGGFVTNPTEGARIHTPEYRSSLADAIAGGIHRYRKALQARPAN